MNAQQTWNNNSREMNFAHLILIGASETVAHEMSIRTWAALSLWVKRGMKKLYKKLEEEAARSAITTATTVDPTASGTISEIVIDEGHKIPIKPKRSRPKSRKRRVTKKGKK